MLREFRNFVIRGNAIDLAVGVIVGAAFGAVVTSLVTNVINPVIAFVVGSPDFNDALTLSLPKLPWADQAATLRFGALLTTLITFVGTMAGVFFFIVKPINAMNELRRPEDEAAETVERACPECLSDIPYRAHRCRYCTSHVEPADS